MDGVASTRAVVLNPVGKQGVKSIPGREIQTAIVKPGINNEGGFSVHLNEKANTTTITTKKSTTSQQADAHHKNSGQQRSANSRCTKQCLATKSEGSYTCMELNFERVSHGGLECRTITIVYARPMGKGGRTVLVAFEDKNPLEYVRFPYQSIRVADITPYLSSAIPATNSGTGKTYATTSPVDAIGARGHEHAKK